MKGYRQYMINESKGVGIEIKAYLAHLYFLLNYDTY